MSAAREEVLDRIRRALQATDVPPSPVARSYRRDSDHPAGSAPLVDRLVDRLQDYRATVVRCAAGDDEIGAAVQAALHDIGATRVVAPAGLPAGWVTDSVVDDELTATQLDELDAVVTASVVAIAETGTIVLDGGPQCGRRAITLVPDVHVCVVRADQVVGSVPEGLALVDPLRPLTFISGPSATSDIELDRVEGVHGPRTLIVVIAGAPAA